MSARNSVHHKRKLSLLFSSAPNHTAKHLHKCAQPFTFLDEVELQKYLKTCLRKVITRTLEHFLNIFEMFCRVFSSPGTAFDFSFSADRKTMHESCDHYFWREVAPTSGRFNLQNFKLKESSGNFESDIQMWRI